jgi:replication factor C subunit 2/4
MNILQLPWIEKYRPKKLDNIIDQDEIINLLKKSIETGELPHLIIYGPPGTGKTTVVSAFATELFGPENYSQRVLELNASDDRGIDCVRNKINQFAKIALSNPDKNYPSPDFKLIILDEADAMTTEAQAALRKVMEEYSHITRFCFICNYINQIIDPIVSRCMKFRFKPIKQDILTDRLHFITKHENIKITENAINAVCKISYGDARKSIMILQNIKYLADSKQIEEKDIYDITGYIPEDIINNIWKITMTKNLEELIKSVKELIKYGYSTSSIIIELKNKILESKIKEEKKCDMLIVLGNTEKNIIKGGNEFLQILNTFSSIYKIKNFSI